MGLDRLEFNSEGVQALLNSAQMREDLARRGRAIAGAAGPGHRVEVTSTGKRARVVVITDTLEARLGEARHRNLTRAIDAGRQ